MNEETRVFLMDLRTGQHRGWFEDSNVIVLASHLDTSGQALALTDAGRADLI